MTVTDRFGCSDVTEVEVGVGTSTEALQYIRQLVLAPNPTRGPVRLEVDFHERVNFTMQVVDLMGRPLAEWIRKDVRRLEEQLDLSQLPGGLYLLRLAVNGQVYTKKIMVVR